jgi:hypothetical protein
MLVSAFEPASLEKRFSAACASGHHDCQQQGTYDADVFHSLFLPHRIVAVARLRWRHGNQGLFSQFCGHVTRLLTFALVIL